MSRTGTAALTVYDVIDGSIPTFDRYYSNYPGLHSEMGDPTTPGSGVTWTVASGAAPTTAYWVADRYTIDGVTSAWQIYPVQAKDGGIPFVSYTKAGHNKPVLGDSTWIADAISAVSDFTGRSYTNQKEFGYGTTVVITYDDGKLYGTYERSGSTDTWTTPASFIDGDLIVDGTVTADQIKANSITASEIAVGTITSSEIAAGSITSTEIAAETIDASRLLTVGASTTPKVADYTYIASAVSDLAAGTATGATGDLYAWLLETVNGYQRADVDNSGSINVFDVTDITAYTVGDYTTAQEIWITDYIDTPIKSVSFTEGTLPDTTKVITHETVGAVETGFASADINTQASTTGVTVINGGAIKADELNITDMNLTGVLDIALGSGNNGALSWGKTNGGDFSTQGMFFGVEAGDLKFNLGSPSSYIYFDGTTIQLVGTNSVAAVPDPITQYQTAGTYTVPMTSSNVGQTLTIKILGGGGGGGAGGNAGGSSSPGNGAGYAGSTTSVTVYTAAGSVRSAYSVGGGAGGAYWYGYDVGQAGASTSNGSIFVGSGGASGANNYAAQGGPASGNGAGGGGAGDAYNNHSGGGGSAGSYGTTTFTVVSNTDYIVVIVGAKGSQGYSGIGNVTYPKYGGHGSSGAAEIAFT